MKTAISIPGKLFAEAEREAKRRCVSRSKLYQEALMRGRPNVRHPGAGAAQARHRD